MIGEPYAPIAPPRFCKDCRWLEPTEPPLPPKAHPNCLRPQRTIVDMVTGETLAGPDAGHIAARAERKGFDPGACGPEARFFAIKA